MTVRSHRSAGVLCLLMSALLMAGPSAHAQRMPPVRIGILDYGKGDATRLAWWNAFRERLAQLGYVENRNVLFEPRFAEADPDRLHAYAAELVKAKVHLIATGGTPAAIAAKQATSKIPIVTATGSDFDGVGLVRNLARPGGNLTGVTSLTNELSAKRVQLLRTFVPAATRVAALYDESNSASRLALKDTLDAATSLRITVIAINVRNAADLGRADNKLQEESVHALIILASPAMLALRRPLAELAFKRRLPAITGSREYAEAGGLISYGTDYPQLFRRAAEYADQILKGAKPGDMPIEQPNKFSLVVNTRTATALGMEVPQAALALADEVIR